MTERTDQQNKALHLWLRQSAKALNDAGVSQEVFIRALIDHGLDVHWTEESFKYLVWATISEAMTGEKSTAAADTTQYNAIYQGLCKFAGSRLGVQLPEWPERHPLAGSRLDSQGEAE